MESVEEAADGIRKGLKYVSAQRLYPHPDCGLKTRTVEETLAKCRIVVDAARKVRAELKEKVPA
jgi:5-methyltetrahydropteroyltriglutamate--homocysteine methyltransferase